MPRLLPDVRSALIGGAEDRTTNSGPTTPPVGSSRYKRRAFATLLLLILWSPGSWRSPGSDEADRLRALSSFSSFCFSII